MTHIQADTILVIAYGNSLRQDDAAGLILAKRLVSVWQEQAIKVAHLAVQQLTPDLAWEMAQPNIAAVLFLDTYDVRHSADTPDSLPQPRIEPLSDGPISPSLGHQFNPTMLSMYAAQLYSRKPPAWLITVPGWDFDHGEGLSIQAQGAVDDALRLICRQSVGAWFISPCQDVDDICPYF